MSHLQLRATDGHSFSSCLARPEGLARGGIVVVQEIFGVTGHIERVAEQFAAEGYLAIAPALFDRQERGVDLAYDTAGVVHCGGGIPQVVEPTPRCPMQFHFGEQDTHIPLRDAAKIRGAFPQGEYHTYAAGHGFNCAERASYDAAAAHLAFVRVKEFFGKHLG